MIYCICALKHAYEYATIVTLNCTWLPYCRSMHFLSLQRALEKLRNVCKMQIKSMLKIEEQINLKEIISVYILHDWIQSKLYKKITIRQYHRSRAQHATLVTIRDWTARSAVRATFGCMNRGFLMDVERMWQPLNCISLP